MMDPSRRSNHKARGLLWSLLIGQSVLVLFVVTVPYILYVCMCVIELFVLMGGDLGQVHASY